MDFWIGLLCNDCNVFFYISLDTFTVKFFFTIMNRSICFFQRNVIIIIHRNHKDTNQNIYFLNFYIDSENTTNHFYIMQFLFFSILITIPKHIILFSSISFSFRPFFLILKFRISAHGKIYQTPSSSTLNINNNDWTSEVLFIQDRYIIIIYVYSLGDRLDHAQKFQTFILVDHFRIY